MHHCQYHHLNENDLENPAITIMSKDNFHTLSIQPIGTLVRERAHCGSLVNTTNTTYTASTISSYPTVNFILYIPSPKQRLWIHDAHSKVQYIVTLILVLILLS